MSALGWGLLWTLFDSEAPLGICLVHKQVGIEAWGDFVRDPIARRMR